MGKHRLFFPAFVRMLSQMIQRGSKAAFFLLSELKSVLSKVPHFRSRIPDHGRAKAQTKRMQSSAESILATS